MRLLLAPSLAPVLDLNGDEAAPSDIQSWIGAARSQTGSVGFSASAIDADFQRYASAHSGASSVTDSTRRQLNRCTAQQEASSERCSRSSQQPRARRVSVATALRPPRVHQLPRPCRKADDERRDLRHDERPRPWTRRRRLVTR